MKRLLPLLHGEALTVSGRTVAENLRGFRVPAGSFVRPLEDPWESEGGLAVLRGNLALYARLAASAEQGAVIRTREPGLPA